MPAGGDTRSGHAWITVAEAAQARGSARPRCGAAQVGNLPNAYRSGRVWLTTLPDVRQWLNGARHRPGRQPRHAAGTAGRSGAASVAPAEPPSAVRTAAAD